MVRIMNIVLPLPSKIHCESWAVGAVSARSRLHQFRQRERNASRAPAGRRPDAGTPVTLAGRQRDGQTGAGRRLCRRNAIGTVVGRCWNAGDVGRTPAGSWWDASETPTGRWLEAGYSGATRAGRQQGARIPHHNAEELLLARYAGKRKPRR